MTSEVSEFVADKMADIFGGAPVFGFLFGWFMLSSLYL